MDSQPKVKTPLEHHRDVVAIAEQQLAFACAQRQCDPDNKKWRSVVDRLTDWVQRLQDEERRFSADPAAAGEGDDRGPLPH